MGFVQNYCGRFLTKSKEKLLEIFPDMPLINKSPLKILLKVWMKKLKN